MRNGKSLTLCLTAMLLTLSTTPVMSETLSTEELWELLDEADETIVELMEENTELLTELEASWTSCETIVRETATEAVAVAVKPLIVANAGLVAECVALREGIVLGVITGALVGLLIGGIAGALF